MKIKLNEKVNVRGYTDSGATISLISHCVLSEQQLKTLRKYSGVVKDANGNPIDIMGEINVMFKVKNEIIYEKLLVFKKTSAIVHDLLIGMNLLKFSDINFIKGKVKFRIPQVEKKRVLPSLTNSSVTMRLLSNELQYNEATATAKVVETSRKVNVTTKEEAATYDQRLLSEPTNVNCRSSKTDSSRMTDHHSTTVDLYGGINDIVSSSA